MLRACSVRRRRVAGCVKLAGLISSRLTRSASRRTRRRATTCLAGRSDDGGDSVAIGGGICSSRRRARLRRRFKSIQTSIRTRSRCSGSRGDGRARASTSRRRLASTQSAGLEASLSASWPQRRDVHGARESRVPPRERDFTASTSPIKSHRTARTGTSSSVAGDQRRRPQQSTVQAGSARPGSRRSRSASRSTGHRSSRRSRRPSTTRPARRRTPRLRGAVQPALRAAQRDRPRRQARDDAVHRLHRQHPLARHSGGDAVISNMASSKRRGTSLSSSRAARCPTSSSRSARSAAAR